ncbi:hypothetical protein [uncultured Ruminococcus sp.]|nr:hypothetical protein [uncultured Ruminococcus sp.]
MPVNFMDVFATTPWLEEYLMKKGLCRHCGGRSAVACEFTDDFATAP